MRSLTVAGALLVALSVCATAADAPNIVGTWTPTGRSAARVGNNNTAHYPSAVKPSLTRGPTMPLSGELMRRMEVLFRGPRRARRGKPKR